MNLKKQEGTERDSLYGRLIWEQTDFPKKYKVFFTYIFIFCVLVFSISLIALYNLLTQPVRFHPSKIYPSFFGSPDFSLYIAVLIIFLISSTSAYIFLNLLIVKFSQKPTKIYEKGIYIGNSAKLIGSDFLVFPIKCIRKNSFLQWQKIYRFELPFYWQIPALDTILGKHYILKLKNGDRIFLLLNQDIEKFENALQNLNKRKSVFIFKEAKTKAFLMQGRLKYIYVNG
jgi:hypothetical protein